MSSKKKVLSIESAFFIASYFVPLAMSLAVLLVIF